MNEGTREAFQIGQRCKVGEYFATVRYIGPVPPSQGDWVGIEWDDSERGKHSGDHEGIKYFTCKAGSGSFVRPKKINTGVTFLEAVKQRYDAVAPAAQAGGVADDAEEDMFVLGEDSRITKVHMVGKEKITKKISQMNKLRDISLRDMCISSAGGDRSQIGELLPSLQELNLTHNLLSTWDEVAAITAGLHQLHSFNISENRLAPPPNPSAELSSAFGNIRTLFVNKMNLEWIEVQFIMATFQAIEELHLCQNHIKTLNKLVGFQCLKLLNLEDNYLTDWTVVLESLASLPKLETLILSGNQLTKVIIKDTHQFPSLRTLSLNRNLINEWQSINALIKLHSLRELKFRDNPLVEASREPPFTARQLIIARLGNLTSLNNSEVSLKERQASERYYMKRYAQDWINSSKCDDNKASFTTEHPRFNELIKVHGSPDVTSQCSAGELKVKDSLLTLTLLCPDDSSQKQIVKKLPSTMTVMKLKALLYRLYKVDSTIQRLSYRDSKGQEFELCDDMKDLAFYSVANGDSVLLRW